MRGTDALPDEDDGAVHEEVLQVSRVGSGRGARHVQEVLVPRIVRLRHVPHDPVTPEACAPLEYRRERARAILFARARLSAFGFEKKDTRGTRGGAQRELAIARVAAVFPGEVVDALRDGFVAVDRGEACPQRDSIDTCVSSYFGLSSFQSLPIFW